MLISTLHFCGTFDLLWLWVENGDAKLSPVGDSRICTFVNTEFLRPSHLHNISVICPCWYLNMSKKFENRVLFSNVAFSPEKQRPNHLTICPVLVFSHVSLILVSSTQFESRILI
jgi:hypothetical protein